MDEWMNTEVYCWGKHSDGQLGLGGIEDQQVLSPRHCKYLSGLSVHSIACGEDHTLLLMNDGSVYSCGNNDAGQLGHDKSHTKPGEKNKSICM